MTNFWDGLAAAWEEWHAQHAALTAPATAALIEAAHVGEGASVLDLACGAGDPTLALAERVGPSGRVVGLDGSARMLEAAARFAASRGTRNVEWLRADATSLPFPEASFDGVTCRFGLMFMPVFEALSEVRRVLRGGGRVAVAAWGDASQPYFAEFDGVIARHFGWPPPRAGDAGLFQYALPGTLRSVLENANFSDLREDLLAVTLRWPGTPEAYVASRLAFAPQLAALLDGLPEEESEALRQTLLRHARNRARGDGVTFEGQIVIASGLR